MADDLTPPDPPLETLAETAAGTASEPAAELIPLPSVEVATTTTDLVLVTPGAAPMLRGSIEPKHVRRFTLAYGVLGAVALFALVAFVLVATGVRPDKGPTWSAFQPKGDALARATAIADYVSPRYRLDSGEQLVAARASAPVVQGNIPIEVIAIVKVAADGTAGSNYETLPGDSALTFQLCGLGANCSITSGTPSAERERLLRREALELALYSFKYVGGTESVVAYLPPKPGNKATIALLFRKPDYHDQLVRPLVQTLADTAPSMESLAASPEKEVVESLTGARRYGFAFQALQNGNAALVLDPTKLTT